MRRLRGLVAATVTPMVDDGALDMRSFQAHVQDLLSAGIEGLFVAGTTGEGMLLDAEERLALIRAAVDIAGGRVPIVGLCSLPRTEDTAALGSRLRQAGADGVAALTPFYYQIDAEAMVEHFRRVADTAQCPTYLYSIPGLTGVSLPVEVMNALAAHPYVAGVKYSECNFATLLRYVGTGADVFIGCDALITDALRNGAAGTVSGTAACLPAPFVSLFRRLRDGGDPTSEQTVVSHLGDVLARLPLTACYKDVLVRRGVIASAAVRKPLRPLRSDEVRQIEALLAEART
jgi:dihydrodipicolinate synthase/N-acetylneuraminate lyase